MKILVTQNASGQPSALDVDKLNRDVLSPHPRTLLITFYAGNVNVNVYSWNCVGPATLLAFLDHARTELNISFEKVEMTSRTKLDESCHAAFSTLASQILSRVRCNAVKIHQVPFAVDGQAVRTHHRLQCQALELSNVTISPSAVDCLSLFSLRDLKRLELHRVSFSGNGNAHSFANQLLQMRPRVLKLSFPEMFADRAAVTDALWSIASSSALEVFELEDMSCTVLDNLKTTSHGSKLVRLVNKATHLSMMHAEAIKSVCEKVSVVNEVLPKLQQIKCVQNLDLEHAKLFAHSGKFASLLLHGRWWESLQMTDVAIPKHVCMIQCHSTSKQRPKYHKVLAGLAAISRVRNMTVTSQNADPRLVVVQQRIFCTQALSHSATREVRKLSLSVLLCLRRNEGTAVKYHLLQHIWNSFSKP